MVLKNIAIKITSLLFSIIPYLQKTTFYNTVSAEISKTNLFPNFLLETCILKRQFFCLSIHKNISDFDKECDLYSVHIHTLAYYYYIMDYKYGNIHN